MHITHMYQMKLQNLMLLMDMNTDNMMKLMSYDILKYVTFDCRLHALHLFLSFTDV
jgi:hypothetical protein